MPKFSIVITTYNRLRLLEQAVASALAQTYPCEVVVADDSSTDGTEEYIRSLGDRVIYHRNGVNSGHCVTMNAGVAVAQGDWIKPLDDDDYLAPNCIEEMVKAISQYPQTVICSCQAIQVEQNGTEVSCSPAVGKVPIFSVLQEDIHYGMLLEQLPFGTPVQVAFAKDAFLKSGGWDTTFEINYDDIDSWVKIAQYGDAVFVNQALAYRTLWPEASHLKFSLQQRLEKNISIKNKIYPLVHKKHHNNIPRLQDIHAFLSLYWGLIGLKQRQIGEGLTMMFPAVFSPSAWQMLSRVISSRKANINEKS
ncbi:MAG TPA: glycosyl transferase [Cyanobacteria bacterium UBA11149]|nr:glycosyl transferase [Cyanobacteria bacterium UBA11367]HBE57094.1 glycosyl transferase [Cyanobacteria bacterium UBA11366]HBR76641.1 glycosyl transferase [Cyanobacteria bacterium UBA11159]HBS68359.1 glycosyl transferase [Cyanobacteria bacterium UBA11153]HBW92411.1 glycosyl transferase [Cyanobacteria bacterium UBA11149]HCA94838.1 glycosyl transferase [Cyanobacteria bacterium UBA9226]